MYNYRNKKTGETIQTACKVRGKNWELVEGQSKAGAAAGEAAKETAAAKQSGQKGKK